MIPIPSPVKDREQELINVGVWSDLQRLDQMVRIAQTAAPGVTDDHTKGYAVGTVWIDETNDNGYICLDHTSGAAVWKKITP